MESWAPPPSRHAGPRRGLAWFAAMVVGLASIVAVPPALAQLGQLLSPGRLSRAHQKLEGIAQCQSCHETGQRVTAQKCLACHIPIAQRMRERRGVHRTVTNDCVTCHVEHMGVDAELRPFKTQGFDHAREAGFALDGRHAPIAANCQACHKTRSFLTLSRACASCHTDVHKGTLGTACATCHSVTRAFTDVAGSFDHTKTAFPLTGAHATVTCAQCHPNGRFKGVAFQTCASCHDSPHRPAFSGTCARCHTTTETWRTTQVDHARTAFPLQGLHQRVACASCHVKPPMQASLRFDRCGACHTDVHKGAFAPKDCGACHSESGFGKAPFDHTTTRFPLTGAHAKAGCASCHTRGRLATARTRPTIEFRGLQTACASCHQDPHEGELGTACQACHDTVAFQVKAYTHKQQPAFYAGAHAAVGCAQCHKPVEPPRRSAVAAAAPLRPTRADARAWHVRFTRATTACASCHTDVHLGQVGAQCQTCHAIDRPRFQLAGFSHETTSFPLTGAHRTVVCRACHKPETAAFPAGRGTAVRLKGLDKACSTCHEDVHAGQVGAACESCHTTTGFAVRSYTHRSKALVGFFTGRHAAATCAQCHAPRPTSTPAPAPAATPARVTALNFAVSPRCISCHRDPHNGALGVDCATCHTAEEEE